MVGDTRADSEKLLRIDAGEQSSKSEDLEKFRFRLPGRRRSVGAALSRHEAAGTWVAG